MASDTPPPLPLETPLGGARALDESRVSPPHAPLFWRSLAFLVDAILLGIVGYLLVAHIFMPWLHPAEGAALADWNDAMEKFAQDGIARISGHGGDVFAFYGDLIKKLVSPPAPAAEALAFQSTCMMLTYWIGFTVMEIVTGGASFGKKMFKLRVVRFPHGERPSVFDSIIRSCWKALAVTSMTPISIVFALVDAHWPLFNPLRRSLHDLFSRTLVLDARYDKPEDGKTKERRGDD